MEARELLASRAHLDLPERRDLGGRKEMGDLRVRRVLTELRALKDQRGPKVRQVAQRARKAQ